MVIVCEATVSVAVRADSALLLILTVTEPSPEPDAPDATSIHLAEAVAVHWQPRGAVTVTERWPPPASTAIRDGATV